MCMRGGRLPVWEGGSITWESWDQFITFDLFPLLSLSSNNCIFCPCSKGTSQKIVIHRTKSLGWVQGGSMTKILDEMYQPWIHTQMSHRLRRNIQSKPNTKLATHLSQAGAWLRQRVLWLDRVVVGVVGDPLARRVRVRRLRPWARLPVLHQHRHCHPVWDKEVMSIPQNIRAWVSSLRNKLKAFFFKIKRAGVTTITKMFLTCVATTRPLRTSRSWPSPWLAACACNGGSGTRSSPANKNLLFLG